MNSMCRTCMQNNRILINILEHKEEGINLTDILFECAAVRVQKNDAFPIGICCDCLDRLISSWEFRVMVIKTELKLHSIVNRNDKESILQHSSKCIDMTIVKEETTVVKSEMFNLSGQDNKDVNNRYILCSVTEHDIEKLSKINRNLELSSTSDVVKSPKQNSGVDSNLSPDMIRMKEDVTNTAKKTDLKPSKEEEPENIAIKEEKLLKNCKEIDRIALLANIDKQDDDLDQEKSFSQDIYLNSDESCIADIQNTEIEQQTNKTGDSLDENNQSESENEELDGILLTDNSQKYVDKIIDTLDSEENDLKYLELLAQSRKKKFTRTERRKMFVFCKICKKAFKYRTYTERHVFLHKSDRLRRCDVCDKGFVTKRELNSHKATHSEVRLFACTTCGKAFKSSLTLYAHQTVHSDIMRFTCHLCQKSFKRKNSLNSHLQRHTSEKKYTCDVCGKSFVHASVFSKHKLIHVDGKNFFCPICKKAFSTKVTMRSHWFLHSERRPHSCSYCDKSFKTKDVLGTHLLIHTGEKPYTCKICDKAFRQTSALYKHMRIHTGETPYACEECGSRFKYSHHLLNHMKVHK